MCVISVVIDLCILEQCTPHSASMDLLYRLQNVMKNSPACTFKFRVAFFAMMYMRSVGQVSNVDFHPDQFVNNRYFVVVLVNIHSIM